jgi:hypothetical protein
MSHVDSNSPRISHLSWGHIEVEGHAPFKDAKVFPGGAREWDWRGVKRPQDEPPGAVSFCRCCVREVTGFRRKAAYDL